MLWKPWKSITYIPTIQIHESLYIPKVTSGILQKEFSGQIPFNCTNSQSQKVEELFPENRGGAEEKTVSNGYSFSWKASPIHGQ